MALTGCFVTGTDTGAGKTIVAAAMAAALRAEGRRVAAFKPVVTGIGEPAPEDDGAWPADHVLLAEVTGVRPEDVTTATFAPAVSPHLAAELAGTELDLDTLATAARAAGAGADVLVVEGVGGLLVPLTSQHTIRDLAVALALPLVIAARPGLGTINHCLLTVEAARAAGLDVRAIVFTPWPADPPTLERSNRETVARMARVEVAVLPRVGRADLVAAGAALDPERWLGPAAGA